MSVHENKENPSSVMETHGVEMIPENERKSNGKNVFYVLCGSQFAFGIMALGALPVAFGLGWWAAFWALTLGLAIGSLLLGPISILSQRTGTNGALASGAHFGIKGRVVGSVIDIVIALGFYGLMVLTGAQALVYGGSRLFGWSTGPIPLLIGCIIISAVTAWVAIMGHKVVVAFEKIGTWLVGAIVLISLIVFAPHFDVHYAGGEYLLGSFWPTWILALTTAISVPVSYATFVGDYSRHVPNKYSSKKLTLSTAFGMFGGCWLAMVPAAFMMSTVSDLATPFVAGIMGQSPLGWVIPLIIAGVFGSIPNGSLCLYSAGLSLETIGWGVKRVTMTIIMAIVGIILVLAGIYDPSSMISLIDAFVIIITVGVSPWLGINLVGHYLLKGRYVPQDLHLRSAGSAYWFTGGYRISAIVSWAIGVVIGLMFTGTTIYVGPFVQAVGGIDLSFLSSAIIGSLLYFILAKVFTSKAQLLASEAVSDM